MVSAGGRFLSELKPEQEIPDGWKIIRPPREVYTMIEDKDIIWAAGQDGVYKIDQKSASLIEKLETPREVSFVKGLLMDHMEALWIGHFNGITVYKNGGFKKITTEDGLPDNRINYIYEDSHGDILVGTWGGVAKFDGIGWELINKDDGLMEDMVNVIYEDSFGGYWFGHYVAPRGGVSYYLDGKWQYFSTDNGLPHNNITAIFEDEQKDIWIGTGLFERGGAAKISFSEGIWTISQILTVEDGLAGEKVRSIYQNTYGEYWIGSEYDGVTVMKNGKSTILTEEEGLSGYEVKVMFEDVDGNMWMGSQNGISFIEKRVLSYVLNPQNRGEKNEVKK